jgi:hypothetical protein
MSFQAAVPLRRQGPITGAIGFLPALPNAAREGDGPLPSQGHGCVWMRGQ